MSAPVKGRVPLDAPAVPDGVAPEPVEAPKAPIVVVVAPDAAVVVVLSGDVVVVLSGDVVVVLSGDVVVVLSGDVVVVLPPANVRGSVKYETFGATL